MNLQTIDLDDKEAPKKILEGTKEEIVDALLKAK